MLVVLSSVALIPIRAKYIFLLSALCNVTPIMQLIEEIKQQDIHVLCTLPHVYFTSIEDN
ncbi:hypothetical protein ACHAXS_002298 [Conticribra weissflogii]